MLSHQTDPRFALGGHKVTARLVPLLAGGWFYASECRCGHVGHGRACSHADVEVASVRSLPCFPGVRQALYQESLSPKAADALVARCLPGEQVVRGPYGYVDLRYSGSWGDVAVDASVRPGGFGVAAVSGAGWVQVLRADNEPDSNTHAAELLAVHAGVSMMPPGTTGRVWCDNLAVVERLDRLAWRRPDYRHPGWASERLHQSLTDLLRERNMTVRWRRRCSTPMLELADTLAKLASAPVFDGQAMAEHLDWTRPADSRAAGRTRYLYCTTDGALV